MQARYSEPVSKPRNREVCGRKGSRHKNTLGCMARITLTLAYVAASNGDTVRGVSERAPVINQGPQLVVIQ